MPRRIQHEREFYRIVGERIRTVRQSQRLTLALLGSECGLKSNSISRIETGDRPVSVARLVRIADALAVPPFSLIPVDARQVLVSSGSITRGDDQ